MNGVRAFEEEPKAFAGDLRRLRLDRGNRSYRELATRAAKSKTGIRLPVSTQSDAFRGDRLPGLDGLMGLVRILHSYDEFGQERPVPPHNSPELEPWRRRWRELAALAALRRSPAPEPAAAPATGPSFTLAHVLAMRADEWVMLWDPADPKGDRLELEAHVSTVRAVAFSPDGRQLATGYVDGRVILWDVSVPGPLGRSLPSHAGPVHDLAFSPQGHRLAGAGADGAVQLWDISTGEAATDLPLTGHSGAVRGVSFSPDASLLASAGDDGTLRCRLLPTPHAPTARPR